MKVSSVRFNIYLSGVAALLLLVSGCETTQTKVDKKRSKEASTLRVYLETNPSSGRSINATVYRKQPMLLAVENEPFLSEANVAAAAVVPALGGFSLKIQFDQHGTWVLENTTTSSPGRRLVIFSQFGEARWLAAPLLTRRISDGQLVFTPDASPEEAERIVRGLNNIARAVQKKSRF